MNFLKVLAKTVQSFFFPPQCILCESILEPLQEDCICDNCRSKTAYCRKRIRCKKCGKPVTSYGKRQICYFCYDQRTKYFDKIVSVFEYKGALSDSVVRYKTQGLQSYARVYGDEMYELFLQEYAGIDFDFICTAPSHTDNNIKHGFDTTELICSILSRKTEIPMKRLLKKSRKTSKQTELSYRKRLENLKNSMVAETDLTGKTVLLVDDVCTTRATIIECSRALKAAGAKRVYAITLATTAKESS